MYTLIMAVALQLQQPVFDPPEVREKVEVAYLEKPFLPITEVVVIEPRKPSPSLRIANVEIIGESNEQCVVYAKRITGITRSLYYAGDALPQGENPQVNSIALERKYGHAMVVEKIEDNGIWVTESNFVKGKINRRFVTYDDIRGYIYN